MCTVSWLRDAKGYEVFCNRDEKLTRQIAAPPRLAVRDGVRYLAPVDGDFGGTWIATNEFGLTLALLNSPGPAPARPTSRGLLLLDLIAAHSVYSVHARIAAMRCRVFAPFILAAVDTAAVRTFRWTGSHLWINPEPAALLTSSSFDTRRVCRLRRERFRRLTAGHASVNRDLLLEFHADHCGPPGAHSTCMHRADAATVSFSHVRVARGETRFYYRPGPLCRPAPGHIIPLSRFQYDSNAAFDRSSDAA